MAGQTNEVRFPMDRTTSVQSRLKLFLANFLYSSHLAESCKQEGFFTGYVDGKGKYSTRRLHYVGRIPAPTRSNTDPTVLDHSTLPFDNCGVKCVEILIYTDKGFTVPKPQDQDIPPWERYQLREPRCEKTTLRCYNIIAEATLYTNLATKDIYHTMEEGTMVKWQAQICRDWTIPKDEPDNMHLVLKRWVGENGNGNGILDLIQAQAELEAKWLNFSPEESGFALLEAEEWPSLSG